MKKRIVIVLLVVALLAVSMQHYRENHPRSDDSKGMVERLTEWVDKLGLY